MLFITVEGGMVQSVSTDNPVLKDLLNKEGVAIIDYDTEGADEDEILTVVDEHEGCREITEVIGHLEEVCDTSIDSNHIREQLV